MVRIGQEIDELHLEIEQASGFRFPAALDLDGQGRLHSENITSAHIRWRRLLPARELKKKSKREEENV